MTRRTLRLLVTLAIGLLSAPLTSEAQTPLKIPRLGILEGVPGVMEQKTTILCM